MKQKVIIVLIQSASGGNPQDRAESLFPVPYSLFPFSINVKLAMSTSEI
ncbi:hypothetical protein [Moorena producens]|nr:hypothetical protein [Moorena producens]